MAKDTVDMKRIARLSQEQKDELTALENARKDESLSVPPGYVKIDMSTEGRIFAPKSLHIRNFDTKDLLGLALTDETELPEKVCEMVDNLILEDISVADFHEKEIIELLVRLYLNFFSNKLSEVDFQYTDADLEILKEQYEEGKYRELLADLKSGKWKPKTEVYLPKVETYDVDETVKGTAIISNKKTGFSVGFRMPKYGDILIIKKFLKSQYEKEDKRWASIKKMVEFKNDMEKRYREGEDVDLRKVPYIPETEYLQFKEYELEKTLFSVDIIRAIGLVSFEGQPVEHLSIAEKVELVQDPRIDVIITKKMDDYFNSLQFGLKPEVMMYNPFTKKDEKRRFSFRIMDILQAIKSFESDEYAIDFVNEDQ